MSTKRNLVIFSGAGISEESGLKTYSGENGLWRNYSFKQCASKEAWNYKPQRVLDFYNECRREVLKAKPNKAHISLAKVDELFNTTIITQNIDDLHERAGSKNVIHIHGEIMKVRNSKSINSLIEWKKDLKIGNLDKDKYQLRPAVVLFGEKALYFEKEEETITQADIFIVIGTSLNTYPAFTLIDKTKKNCIKYFIDTELNGKVMNGFHHIKQKATTGVPELVNNLLLK